MVVGNFFLFHYLLPFFIFMHHIILIETILEQRNYCKNPSFRPLVTIVGGDDVAQGEFPWIVSLQRRMGISSRFPICGGTIVASSWILTAAHCVCNRRSKHLTVVAGRITTFASGDDKFAQLIKVDRIFVPKLFNDYTLKYDVAMLRLKKKFTFDTFAVKSISLPSSRDIHSKAGTVIGYGRTSEVGGGRQLKKVDLPVWNYSECVSFFETNLGSENKINECNICAGDRDGGKDSCNGDSGGPLVVKNSKGEYVIIGIVSWGIGCARPNRLGVYTNVACFTGWIRHLIETKSPISHDSEDSDNSEDSSEDSNS